MLQIKICDAENERSKEIELAAAKHKAINGFKTIRTAPASALTKWKIIAGETRSRQGKMRGSKAHAC